jgi:parvulin-like peptidyl-prolyl isomerase
MARTTLERGQLLENYNVLPVYNGNRGRGLQWGRAFGHGDAVGGPKKMAIQLAAYAVVTCYLCLDLWVFRGPLSRTITRPRMDSEEMIAEAKAQGIAARVYFQPIYRAQVDERARQYLWERGRTFADTTVAERHLLREGMVHELIDELLIKIQIKISPAENFAIPEGTQQEVFALFEKRYGTAEVFDALLADQKWREEEEARMRINARLQREKYLNSFLPDEVTEEEAREWYEKNRKEMRSPVQRMVRQIFVSTLTSEVDAARELVEAARARVVDKNEDFSAVAGSVESASKLVDLGWVTADKLPQDFSLAVFSLPLNKPQVVQSKFGWHLIEVTAVEEGEVPDFEEVAESVTDAIRQSRKEAHLVVFRRYMRNRAKGKIEIFEDVLFAEDVE